MSLLNYGRWMSMPCGRTKLRLADRKSLPLTHQPNPRTDGREWRSARTRSLVSCLSHSQILRSATAATVAQVAWACPPTPCCSPLPPWPSAPGRHRWRSRHPGTYPGTYPRRTSSPSALDSTLAGAGGAEDCHEASTRYASTSFPLALLFFLNYLR